MTPGDPLCQVSPPGGGLLDNMKSNKIKPKKGIPDQLLFPSLAEQNIRPAKTPNYRHMPSFIGSEMTRLEAS